MCFFVFFGKKLKCRVIVKRCIAFVQEKKEVEIYSFVDAAVSDICWIAGCEDTDEEITNVQPVFDLPQQIDPVLPVPGVDLDPSAQFVLQLTLVFTGAGCLSARALISPFFFLNLWRPSHSKHAQGAGLVLQTQDAVGNSFQMARQPHPDVLDIPGSIRKETITHKTLSQPFILPSFNTVSPRSLAQTQQSVDRRDSGRLWQGVCRPR